MRLKDYLAELAFKKSTDVEVAVKGADTFRTLFTIDGVRYIFVANDLCRRRHTGKDSSS